MALKLLTPPTTEPVTLAEAKLHLRIDGDVGDDTLVAMLLAAARQWAEEYCRRSFITQTWRLTLDAFPPVPCAGSYSQLLPRLAPATAVSRARAAIALRRGPVASVTSVKYIDATGTLQTLASSEYSVDADALPPTIVPAYGKTWPTTRDQGAAVTVDYVTGYGAAGGAAPAPVRAAILLMLGDLYQNREAQVVGTIVNANPTATALLGPFVIEEAV